MPTGDFDAVKGHNADLVRIGKMQELAIFAGPYETAPLITTISDNSNALVIPVGYESLGIVSKGAGPSIAPNLEMTETTGYGYSNPLFRDVVTRADSVSFTLTENKRAVFEAYFGMSLAAVQATAAPKNELRFSHPDRYDAKYWRMLLLGKNGQGTATVYRGEYYSKMILTDAAEQQWSETEELGWGVTFSADIDTTAGTARDTYWAGPGLSTSMLTGMGFTRGS